MNKNTKNTKTRHSSLDMADADVVKRKYDMLTKARNKIFHFGDGKPKNTPVPESPTKKTGKYPAIECLFKATHRPMEKISEGPKANATVLKKQNSLNEYPVQIQVEEYNDCTISRERPSTICVDKIDHNLGTAALALERPRKKLSFKEPEKSTCPSEALSAALRCRKLDTNTLMLPSTGGMKRSISFTNGVPSSTNMEDYDSQSQAMRVVRTVGQAFEVCHKLSITAPENENADQEEQETLTQDLMSDRLSDITSDKGRKDFHLDLDIERLSLPGIEDCSPKDLQESRNSKWMMPKQHDLLPPPPSSSNKPSSLISTDVYSSPQSDVLTTESAVFTSSLTPSGSTLSAHHEIQLLKEQLDQQSQQTQAAIAQLQLAREQLAAEQTARMEAQSRTHQLLVHNRELLDHIASLVSHLQSGSENSGGVGSQQQNSGHVTLPQHQPSGVSENYMPDLSETSLDNSLHQALGLNPQDFIENRAVTSCLPPSPLNNYNPSGTVFNFPYAQQASYENQLLQSLQALGGYSPTTSYPFTFNPTIPYFQSPYYPTSSILNNNFTLPHPHKYGTMSARNSYADKQVPGMRHSSEPRQIPYQYHSSTNLNFAVPSASIHVPNISSPTRPVNPTSIKHNSIPQMRQTTPPTPTQTSKVTSPFRSDKPSCINKPQISSLTTTDSDGKVRVIVPVPSSTSNNSINNNNDPEGLLANLRLTDDFRMNGPPIQRSTSEKVPNRSELMAQVTRAMWARHTTK